MSAQNKALVKEYIQKVWNEQQLNLLNHFIHEEYKDHSFIAGIPQSAEGLIFWISNTSIAFDHKTIIESIIAESHEVIIRIRFKVKHTGKWRSIEPTLREAEIRGFRHFRIRDHKIIEHWALLDGESLESALREKHQGCVIPES